AKESLHAIIQALQDILENLRMYRLQILAYFLYLWQLVLLILIADRDSGQAVGISPLLQRGIEQFAANRKRILKQGFLPMSGIDSKFERFSHLSLSLSFNVSLDYFQRRTTNCNDK